MCLLCSAQIPVPQQRFGPFGVDAVRGEYGAAERGRERLPAGLLCQTAHTPADHQGSFPISILIKTPDPEFNTSGKEEKKTNPNMVHEEFIGVCILLSNFMPQKFKEKELKSAA